jgi:hypothetical protein
MIPGVPTRQWVLTPPYTLRFLMAYDAKLTADIHRVFVRAVFASLRRRAGLSSLGRNAKGGAVAFVQRFGDALNLNVHFHMLALDGVYGEDGGVGEGAVRPSRREAGGARGRRRRLSVAPLRGRGRGGGADAVRGQPAGGGAQDTGLHRAADADRRQ